MRYLRGAGPIPVSLDSVEQPHCGTSIAFELFLNLPQMSESFRAAKPMARPALSDSMVSPAQRFMIHYTTSGVDAVYQSNVDIAPADGIPDYVNRVSEIADSVYNFITVYLGFPPPPQDDFYPDGGDSLYDIYIQELGLSYYGYTQGEIAINAQSATSYLVIDNNYNFAPYSTRPLDAVRVTVAHEFFHAIHFGMDYTEYEGANTYDDPARLYWWEMSSTWMEEAAYDAINDYYGYLKAFYDYPWLALQDFSIGNSLHPYGAAVFPIYLSEKFGPSIVREIWERCRDYGTGPQFLRAANEAIMEASNDSCDLGRAFAEFTLWNFFIGPRSARLPSSYTYIKYIKDTVWYHCLEWNGDSSLCLQWETVPGPPADSIDVVWVYDTIPDIYTGQIGFSEAAGYYSASNAHVPDSAFIPHSNYPFFMIWPNWPTSTPDISPEKMAYFKQRTPQNLGANYIALNNLGPDDDTAIFRASGGKDAARGLKWHFVIVGFSTNPVEPANVRIHRMHDSSIVTDSIFTSGYFRFFAIPSLSSVVNEAYINGSTGYPLGYLVADSVVIVNPDDSSLIIVKMLPPHPNPIVVRSSDDVVNFRFVFNRESGIPGETDVNLSIDLFTASGEKILSPDLRDIIGLDDWPIYGDTIVWSWNLVNHKGKTVAPGVYVAVIRVQIPDMRIDETKKYKLAVIK
ncbi:MAG: hypothetical protein HRF51_03705 [bacterium]